MIEDVAKNGGNNLMQLLYETRTGPSDVSHMIFQISPITTDTDRLFVFCQYEAVSRWTLDLLLRRYEANKATAVADFFHGISTMREAASPRGSLFDRQVLMYFNDTATDHDLSMRELTSSDQITWTFLARTRRVSFKEPGAIGKIEDAVETNKPLHLVPSDPKFPAVVYHQNEVLKSRPIVNTLLLSRGFGVFNDGSRMIHHLQVSALTEQGRGVSYLLCRQKWRLPSHCKRWRAVS